MQRVMITVFATFFMLIFAGTAFCATYLVKPDGTGDFPTIQAAMNAAVGGDTILLEDGVFKGPENRNIDFKGKAITLRSQSGHAEHCIIDAEGVPNTPQRCIDFKSGEGADSIVRDITVMHGTTDDC